MNTNNSEFQQDVFGELQSVGTVVQFKVCCNYQPHLRGNVYAQYSSVKEAIRAYLTFQGRWYDGRQLACYFVDIPSWKAAICGKFSTSNRCEMKSDFICLLLFTQHYYITIFYGGGVIIW